MAIQTNINLREEIRKIVDPLFMKFRQDLYGSGITYNTYISDGSIPPSIPRNSDVITIVTNAGFIKGIKTYSGGILKGTDQTELDFVGFSTSSTGSRTTITHPSGAGTSNAPSLLTYQANISGGVRTVISNPASGIVFESDVYEGPNGNDSLWKLYESPTGVTVVNLDLTPHTGLAASDTVLGHVRVGSGLKMSSSGVLSISGQLFTNPLTTLGDIIVAASGGTQTRFPVSTFSGYVLTADPTQPLKVNWSNPGGGGFGLSVWSADNPPSSPSTDDDEFADSSLAGAWTAWDVGSKNTVTEVAYGLNMSYVAANGSYNVAGIYKALAAGDFSIMTKVSVLVSPASYFFGGLLLGQDLTNNPGTSDVITFGIYQGAAPANYVIQADRWTQYNGSPTSQASQAVTYPFSSLYLRIRRISTNLNYDYSIDGISFVTLGSVAQGFTAVEYGLCVNGNNNKTSTGIFQFFRRISGTSLGVPILGRRN